MRYYYEKPKFYQTLYGEVYHCNHPLYNSCTLFKVKEFGLAVIQQRWDPIEKHTWWTEIDPWLNDSIYSKKEDFNHGLERIIKERYC